MLFHLSSLASLVGLVIKPPASIAAASSALGPIVQEGESLLNANPSLIAAGETVIETVAAKIGVPTATTAAVLNEALPLLGVHVAAPAAQAASTSVSAS